MISSIYMIGFGLIARTLLEIWNVEHRYENIDLIVIEPDKYQLQRASFLFKKRNLIYIELAITPENADTLLSELDENSLVVDLSVDVDSLMIMQVVSKHNAIYINTSVENYCDNGTEIMSDSYEKFKDETLYYRQNIIEKKIKSKSSMLTNCGANPGLISSLGLLGLEEISKHYYFPHPLKTRNDFATFCKMYVKSICCTELDTTEINFIPKADTFYNTWSPVGMLEEAGDIIQISHNKKDKSFQNENLISPSEKSNTRFINKHGFDETRPGKIINPFGQIVLFDGWLIPHRENISLGEYLKVGEYSPSCYYIYHPSNVTVKCLEKAKKNDYARPQEFHGIIQDEMIAGYDSLGSYITMNDGSQFFYGTCLDLKQVKNLGFHVATPTSLQVAASIDSGIKYILNNRDKGIIESEDVNHKILFEEARKYLGTIYKEWL